MNCTKCGEPLAENENGLMRCDCRKTYILYAIITSFVLVMSAAFLLVGHAGQNGDLLSIYESDAQRQQGEALIAAEHRAGDIAVARIDGTYIWASELGHELWIAEQNLIEEHFGPFAFGIALDHDGEFRDGLTFGEAIIHEAVISAAANILFEAEAEFLGVSLTDEERMEIQQNILEAWGGDLSSLFVIGITTGPQLTRALENYRIRLNVLYAMFAGLNDAQRFDRAIELDVLWAAQHILIGFGSFDTEGQALELAEKLHARILAGEDFERLMLEYSDDQNPAMPPDTYTFTSGIMVSEFEYATRELAIGEISLPIRSSFGYHIIRRVEPVPHGVFGDVSEALFEITVENFMNEARARIEFLQVPSWDQINLIFEEVHAIYEPRIALSPSEFVENNDSWIMVYKGEQIATSDFAFISVLMQQPINRFTKHEILRELLTFLVVMEMGERYGVGFTSAEIEEIEARASFFRVLLSREWHDALDFISDRRLGEFLSVFEFVAPRLVDLIIDYVPDETIFEHEFERFMHWQVEENTEVLVKYLAMEFDGIEDVMIELFEDDFDFDDIALRHCVKQTGLEPISLDEFAWQYGLSIDLWLAEIPIGQYSPIQVGEDYFFVFYIYDRILPDLSPELLEIVESDFRESFIRQRSTELFFELLTVWVDEAEYELNHRLFDAIF